MSDRVSVLMGPANGAYPAGNSLVVRGSSEAFLIDPSVAVVERGGAPVRIDALLNSHSHEDHVAGNGLFEDARVHIHDADLVGVQSLEGMSSIFGFENPIRDLWEAKLVETFHYSARPDAEGFSDGAVFDLGGVSIEAVHLPGHTRGHSGFRVSEGVFFLSDIDLTGFGPYYGDAWSDLDDFIDSLGKVREEEADYYVTSHQKGVIEGRADFLERLDAFAGVIDRRHGAMLEFLSEPRTLDEMVNHRFVYRPRAESPIIESVERRSARLHLERMQRFGEVRENEPGIFERI